MKRFRKWYDQLSYNTRSALEMFATIGAFVLGIALLVLVIVSLGYYAGHGDREEPCYEDLSCEDALVCVSRAAKSARSRTPACPRATHDLDPST